MPTKRSNKSRVPNLDTLLAKWQKRLSLRDWNIVASYAKADQSSITGKYGTLHPELESKRVWITILHPAAAEYSHVEATVVHELVHLLLYPLTCKYAEGSLENILEEQAVHALTTALMAVEYD